MRSMQGGITRVEDETDDEGGRGRNLLECGALETTTTGLGWFKRYDAEPVQKIHETASKTGRRRLAISPTSGFGDQAYERASLHTESGRSSHESDV